MRYFYGVLHWYEQKSLTQLYSIKEERRRGVVYANDQAAHPQLR